MKKILLPILMLFVTISSNAQNILTPVNPIENGKASDFELIIDGEFENKGDADSFVWNNTIITKTKGWGLAVCDNIQCYDTNVYTQIFYVTKGGKANFDVHAYPYGIDGSSIAKIKVYRISDMSDSVVNTYTFNAVKNGAGIKKAKTVSFEVYPNPAKDELTVNFESTKAVEMRIFNVLGVEIMKYIHTNNESKINVSQLQAGVYFIKFIDESGKAYAKSFKKIN